ncbi:MAG: beta-ketoacyl-ACP synthase 3, partial [Planctomycetes bacterium]|nr:beta-ketoacyl-ACP synthase 3 [Planctomycetota bacterium]
MSGSGDGVRVRIAGTGLALPERILTNAELEKMIDTTGEWIVQRTGIRERRLASPEETTSVLATRAASETLERAGRSPRDVDMIIVATITPDNVFPCTACHVQRRLGVGPCAAFDVSAACSGFLHSLTVGWQMIAAGAYRNVLVIGAETMSRITDYTDRSSCILFGDGAGAVLLV